MKFDYIIVDTAPLVPVTDIIILTKKLDAVIVVLMVGVVTRVMAKETSTKSVYSKKVLGVALNGVIRKGSYYYYYK